MTHASDPRLDDEKAPVIKRRYCVANALLLGFGALALTGCVVPQPRGGGLLSRVVEPTRQRGYWRYLPKGYSDAGESNGKRWPLVVSFHGMKPFDNARPQALEWQQEADRYGFIVVAPELRSPDVLSEFPVRSLHPEFVTDMTATMAILDHVFATTEADSSNVLATSWSSGGYMAHYALNTHPERFTCLVVRQSNFSASVLDAGAAVQSQYHPVLILNTQNDFKICREESAQAVQWYERLGYKNVAWVHIKNHGHERTPDIAASFFAQVAGAQPQSAPAVLVKRQAIAGNEDGLDFFSGKKSTFQRPPQPLTPRVATARSNRAVTPSRPPAGALARKPDYSRTQATMVSRPPTPERAPAIPALPALRERVNIIVSNLIGIQPLHVSFRADCPRNWLESADFLWELDGAVIANGANGHKTLNDPGNHLLSLLVVTSDGETHRAQRTLTVYASSVFQSAAAQSAAGQ